MQLSAVTAPQHRDPNQPTLPGLEPGVIARFRNVDREYLAPISIREDRPVNAPTFSAFEDALTAAREIMIADRRDARWGMFKRHEGKVDAIALLADAERRIRLVRTNMNLDPYTEPVPGQMFPGQNWRRGGVQSAVRETPATLALVGADGYIDLRADQPAARTPFPAAGR